jgi:hypothetical protein
MGAEPYHSMWTLSFSAAEFELLNDAVFLVRSGRSSFYSSILRRDRSFLRFDPACMEPADHRARTALTLFTQATEAAPVIDVEWTSGAILILDNWRMLHGRGNAERAGERALLRSAVE